MSSDPVRGGNLRALARELSPVQVDNHDITISYHIHRVDLALYDITRSDGRCDINVALNCWSNRRLFSWTFS